jgi:hypothetical protein
MQILFCVRTEDDCECDSRGVEAGAKCDPATGRCMCKVRAAILFLLETSAWFKLLRTEFGCGFRLL